MIVSNNVKPNEMKRVSLGQISLPFPCYRGISYLQFPDLFFWGGLFISNLLKTVWRKDKVKLQKTIHSFPWEDSIHL